MILDGKALASDILARTKARVAALERTPRILALVSEETAATTSYLAIKAKRAHDAGCELIVERAFGQTTEALIATLRAHHDDVDAIIVQLPLGSGVDTHAVCDAIPLEQDADVLSARAREKSTEGDIEALLPPVVGAVSEILAHGGVTISGTSVAVVGAGFLVGAPVALWLARQGAVVTVVAHETKNLAATLSTADIVISGTGVPHLITPTMLKRGAVLIDAGTSESGGAIVGDADPACAEVCSLFTPVPGGVGPVAVAKLFENVAILAERAGRR